MVQYFHTLSTLFKVTGIPPMNATRAKNNNTVLVTTPRFERAADKITDRKSDKLTPKLSSPDVVVTCAPYGYLNLKT